jgi:hypothetical protein
MPRWIDSLKHLMTRNPFFAAVRSAFSRYYYSAGFRFTANCKLPIACFLFLLLLGCANIVPPSGGPKDETAPQLVRVSPADSQRNTRIKKLELEFDEYITLSEASSQIQISPLLSLPLTTTSKDKFVTITIPDSLLEHETTYRITFGNAIRDLHEGNIFQISGYTFSTGAFFDSLALRGNVVEANTGLPDTAAFVLLYPAAAGDSGVVRRKPSYVTHVDAKGAFQFLGLPSRSFRVYSLHDANSNLTFDGGKEWIGFLDSLVRPGDTLVPPILLRSFQEPEADTGKAAADAGDDAFGRLSGALAKASAPPPGGYSVMVDTSDIKRRTQNLANPLEIRFGRRLSAPLNKDKIFLSVDSAGVSLEEAFRIEGDSSGLNYKLLFRWREDAVYTMRLQKGFAKDSAGTDLLPGRYSFRTRRDEDYGKLTIHLPGRFYGSQYIFQLRRDNDSVYSAPVRDSNLSFLRLEPGNYSMRVIVDSNKNGVWDPGDLFLRRQPERVIPYTQPIMLKAGWEQQIDFDDPKRRK